MDKYEYRSFKATCLYQKDTPYQDKSAYDEFNKKIHEYTGKKDFLDFDLNPSKDFYFQPQEFSHDGYFIQDLHVLYLFILVNNYKESVSLKDSVLSRIIKLESYPESFIPFQNCSLRRYSMVMSQFDDTYNISEENYFIYYSPETDTFFCECYRYPNCYGEFDAYSVSLRKDYKLPKPLDGNGVLDKDPRDGFRFDSFYDEITGTYEYDKKENDFIYIKEDPYTGQSNETFLNPYSFWLNFYKHYGDFNINDFKKIIKKDAIEVHPFDDSSFDKVNGNPVLQRLLYRNLSYPTGYLRYTAYSFFSKGDEINKNDMVEIIREAKGKTLNAILFFELITKTFSNCTIRID